jgi:hypothetical protein
MCIYLYQSILVNFNGFVEIMVNLCEYLLKCFLLFKTYDFIEKY